MSKSTLVHARPARCTSPISTRTPSSPKRAGSARSHSGSRPQAMSAPRVMSPAMPENGSRIARGIRRSKRTEHLLRRRGRETRNSRDLLDGRVAHALHTTERPEEGPSSHWPDPRYFQQLRRDRPNGPALPLERDGEAMSFIPRLLDEPEARRPP